MQILHQINNDFDAYMNSARFGGEPKGLYDPVKYILSIGGKRLRPASLLLASYLVADEYRQALPAALAVEVFHNFTLIHDDIMDEAPLRRGFATVHQRYGANTGILSGDVMLVSAYRILTEGVPVGLMPTVMGVFNKFATEVCEGQQMDMDFEKTDEVTIPSYLRMIELKTSVLVAGAMQIGALLGGANEQQAHCFYEFGRNLGLAFQIQDDLLDTYGDPKKFGKKLGGDIAQNKKTFLYLKALELAQPGEQTVLKGLFSDKTMEEKQKIEAVTVLFNRLNVRSHAEEKQASYLAESNRHLDMSGIPPDKKAIAETFALNLMAREV